MPTTNEPAIQRDAEAVIGEPVYWHTLVHRGTSNRLFVGRDSRGQQRWVLRINAPKVAAFGADRDREAAVLAAIEGHSWAPRVIANRPETGWCLFARHGDPPAAGGVPAQAVLAAAAQWQRLRLAAAFDYDRLFEAYAQRLAGPCRQLLAALRETLAALPAVSACLTHHDLHPDNLCVGPGAAVVVIDWEYAGVGTPWFDAVALCDRLGAPASAVARLPAFSGLDHGHFSRGLARGRWCTDALDCLWWAARGPGRNGPGHAARAAALLARKLHPTARYYETLSKYQ